MALKSLGKWFEYLDTVLSWFKDTNLGGFEFAGMEFNLGMGEMGIILIVSFGVFMYFFITHWYNNRGGWS